MPKKCAVVQAGIAETSAILKSKKCAVVQDEVGDNMHTLEADKQEVSARNKPSTFKQTVIML